MSQPDDRDLFAGLIGIIEELGERFNRLAAVVEMCCVVPEPDDALEAPGFKIGAAVTTDTGGTCSEHPKYEGKRRCRSGCKGCEAVYAAKHPVVADGLAD